MNLNKKSWILFLAICAAHNNYGMGHTKRALSAAGTIAHYGLAGWMCKEGVERLMLCTDNDAILDATSEEAPEHLQTFVRNIMKREGVKNPDEIKISIYTDPQSPYASGLNTIFIDFDEAMKLTGSFISNDPIKVSKNVHLGCSVTTKWTNKEYITRSIAMLRHEIAHIKNNDALCSAAACFLIPAMTLCASRYKPILSLINKNVPTKIGTGIALNTMNNILKGQYSQYQEYRADDAVTEPIEMLMIMKDFNANSHVFPPNPSIYGQLTQDHPDLRYRIKRMSERLLEE